jgi:hypothetical protein
VLTDDSHGGLDVSLDSLVHIVGAVDWDALTRNSTRHRAHLSTRSRTAPEAGPSQH